MNHYVISVMRCNNSTTVIFILSVTTALSLSLILLIISSFGSNRSIFAMDDISDLSTFVLQKSPYYHYINDVPNTSLHNIGISNNIGNNNNLMFIDYNINNNDNNNYISKIISLTTVGNGGSHIDNCNNNNSNIIINAKTKPIIPYVLPPKIVMMNNGKEYDVGNFVSSKYREDTTFAQLHIPQEKINTHLPNNSTTIVKGSCLGFVVENDPLALPPSSMSITAYDIQGKAVKVFGTIVHSKSNFF